MPRIIGNKFNSPYEYNEQLWLIDDDSDLHRDFSFNSEEQENPLSTWSTSMSKVTNISAKTEIASVYEKLIRSLDTV